MVEYPEMMKVTEAAEFLRCSVRNVYDRLRRGTLPGAKTGKEWRVSKSLLITMTREETERRRGDWKAQHTKKGAQIEAGE